MNPLILTFLAHFLGDYPLQGEFLATWKSRSNYILLVHCFIWASLVSIALWSCNIYDTWKFIFLLVGHYGIDYWKCRTFNSPEEQKKTFGLVMTGMQAFFIDQALHAIQLFIVIIF